MTKKTYKTAKGTIHYWLSERKENSPYLIFLPGLTADHRLFEKQIEYFENKVNVFVWDAPGHMKSTPFDLDFSLMDKAKWLDEILTMEQIVKPVLVGQSMGGYVSQAYAELFPEKIGGFISIDSAPLQRKYVTLIEIWLLKKMEPVYRYYPWKSLLKTGSNGVATSQYGRNLMHDMMMEFDGKQAEYAALAGNGYRMLAEGFEANLKYEIPCKALLICGTKDRAGSCLRYNRAWTKKSGIPIRWIENAGHNSNTDEPELVNNIIEDFLNDL